MKRIVDTESWLDKRYKVQLFIIEKDEDYSNTDLIKNLYKMGYFFSKDDGKETLNLYNILSIIPKPFLIVLEPYYVDMLYRDSYYHYYSEILTEISRNCSRLSFFGVNNELKQKILDPKFGHADEILYDEEIQIDLEKSFIGTVTLRPLYNKIIGRVLLDPNRVRIGNAYLRRTHTMVTICGHGYDLKFFPLASQDGLYMTCAETLLWMIFEYFGLQYSDYHTVLPSEFIGYNAKDNPERTLPASGMNAPTKSRILKNFGLHPKIYALDVFKKKLVHGAEDFYMLFHVYVESGIPLVLSLLDDNGNYGHSVICIGHGTVDYDKLDNGLDDYVSWQNQKYNVEVVDSSQLIHQYIIMDDTSIPYQARSLDRLSLFDNELKYFIAPLNRKVYMDAQYATEVFGILAVRYLNEIAEYLNSSGYESRRVIRRIYLTTARKYKAFRSKHGSSYLEKEFYANLPCAKFIWVMEMGIDSRYREGKVFAEFVLDATGGKESDNAALMIRIGNKVGYHGFDEGYRTNKEIITDVALEKIYKELKNNVDKYQKDRMLFRNEVVSIIEHEINADDSLLAKYKEHLDEDTNKEIVSALYDIITKSLLTLNNSQPIERIDAIKKSNKHDFELFAFKKLNDALGTSFFINSAENAINERLVNCAKTNIFSREFDLYKNNLDHVGLGTV